MPNYIRIVGRPLIHIQDVMGKPRCKPVHFVDPTEPVSSAQVDYPLVCMECRTLIETDLANIPKVSRPQDTTESFVDRLIHQSRRQL